jgi:hypothetical protein
MASSKQGPGKPAHPPDQRLVINSAAAPIHTSLPAGFLNFSNQTWLNFVGLSLEDLNSWK